MKCPKCGINYDDSDRECPMCGAPKPLFAKDKSQLAKTTARPAKSDEKGGLPAHGQKIIGNSVRTAESFPYVLTERNPGRPLVEVVFRDFYVCGKAPVSAQKAVLPPHRYWRR